MASSSDIESSLEMREILQHEVQTLSKEEESLDKEITALILKEKELTQTIETQKVRLLHSYVVSRDILCSCQGWAKMRFPRTILNPKIIGYFCYDQNVYFILISGLSLSIDDYLLR